MKIPWGTALLAAVWPKAHIDADYFLMVVAVLGTTISPYLFFWQASQEVEEMHQGRTHRPLRELSRGGVSELDRIKIDTTVGMMFSNAIAFFIILTTASVLNANGITNINSATQAAEALRPLAGDATFALLHSASSAPAFWRSRCSPAPPPMASPKFSDGMRRWKRAAGCRRLLQHHRRGDRDRIRAGFTGIDAIHMLVWSAVLNGIVAVPIMAMMMVIVSNSRLMGRFKARTWLVALGWVGTGIMSVAVIALLASFLVG